MIMCNWLLLAARTAMIDQCTNQLLFPRACREHKPVAGKLVCQDASSFAFPGVITTVPAAQRTLDFPNAVGHAGHFWHLWHLWHWSGLAGFLYALVAPAPLWAHSVVGTISTFLRSSSVLYELLRRLPKVLAKPAPTHSSLRTRTRHDQAPHE